MERYPTAGKAPSERTEVRVLFDEEHVYFGITCYDSQPELISRRLGRRDSDLFADAVQVMLDPTHDHRTAYLFYLSAGGVQGDGLFYDDRFYTSDWDGVWDGRRRQPPGWLDRRVRHSPRAAALPGLARADLGLLRAPRHPSQERGASRW